MRTVLYKESGQLEDAQRVLKQKLRVFAQKYELPDFPRESAQKYLFRGCCMVHVQDKLGTQIPDAFRQPEGWLKLDDRLCVQGEQFLPVPWAPVLDQGRILLYIPRCSKTKHIVQYEGKNLVDLTKQATEEMLGRIQQYQKDVLMTAVEMRHCERAELDPAHLRDLAGILDQDKRQAELPL